MTIPITLAGWEELSSEEEAVVINWFVRAGQKVESQRLLAEVMVEKVNIEVSAPQAGTIEAIMAPEGTIVTAGTTLALLNESFSPAEPALPAQPITQETSKNNSYLERTKEPFVLASPAARRLAKELNLNLEMISQNLDPTIRVNEAAVINYLTLISEGNSGHETHIVPGRRQAQSRLRKLIRSRVSRSSQFAAAVTLTRKEEITGLLNWLAGQNGNLGPGKPSLTLMTVILKATGLALLDYPLLNAILDGSDIIFMDERNISLVLPLAEGVILPVIHRVDKLSLGEIALAMSSLEAATRRETLHLKDTLGSTFTISDLGSYGVDSFTPILNLPQAAILGVGRVTTEWALPGQVENNAESEPIEVRKVEPRRFVTFSLTFDHRISDGPYSAAFLQRMTEYLHKPGML